MPDNRQDRVGHRHGGALVPTARAQALELGGQVGIQAVGSSPGGFDQRGPQPGLTLTGLAAAPFAGAQVVTRTQTGPGRQVLGGRKRGDVGPHLCQNDFGRMPLDARHRTQALDDRLIRRRQLCDALVDGGDGRTDMIQMRQQFAQHETMVRPHAPGQRFFQLRQLGAQAAARQFGQHLGGTLPADQRLQHRPRRRHLDVGVFQRLLQPVGGRRPLPRRPRAIARQIARLALLDLWNEAALQQDGQYRAKPVCLLDAQGHLRIQQAHRHRDELLMHIQTRTAPKQDFHQQPPATAWRTLLFGHRLSYVFVRKGRHKSWQVKVSRSNSVTSSTGLLTPPHDDLSYGPHIGHYDASVFHPPWRTARHE